MDDETIEMVMTCIMVGCLLVIVGLGVVVAVLHPIEILAFIGLMFVLWVLAEYVFADIIASCIAKVFVPYIAETVVAAAPGDECMMCSVKNEVQ